MKAKHIRQVLVTKERGLFKCWQPEKKGDPCPKPSQYLSAGRRFYKEGKGKRKKEIKVRGWKRSPRADQGQVMGDGCILLVAVEGQQASAAGMTEGWSLCLWRLVPRILIQTCCFSTSCPLVRAHIYRNNIKRTVGWVTVTVRPGPSDDAFQ